MKHSDMLDILQHLQKYVPSITKQAEIAMHTGEPLVVDVIDHHEILLGGDLLSSFRAREVQRIMEFSDQPSLRCDGLLPISEDWHTRLCLLEVSYNYELCLLIIIIMYMQQSKRYMYMHMYMYMYM